MVVTSKCTKMSVAAFNLSYEGNSLSCAVTVKNRAKIIFWEVFYLSLDQQLRKLQIFNFINNELINLPGTMYKYVSNSIAGSIKLLKLSVTKYLNMSVTKC